MKTLKQIRSKLNEMKTNDIMKQFGNDREWIGIVRKYKSQYSENYRILGLMPHPEAIYAQWLHPDFTRGTAPQTESENDWEGQGLQIFRNAIEYTISKNT